MVVIPWIWLSNASYRGVLILDLRRYDPTRHDMAEYVHQALNQEVAAIGGYYTLVKEVRLPFDGQEILYLVGHAVFDTTCCGVGGCAYALVPGYVLSWKSMTNKDGFAISQVEPIGDKDAQEQIRQRIERKEVVQQVRFL
jgi:hypothetical protein